MSFDLVKLLRDFNRINYYFAPALLNFKRSQSCATILGSSAFALVLMNHYFNGFRRAILKFTSGLT
jgi:hypothetical protein